ncbi:GerAB/ArcD/ProY family transporter [Bacillus sp. REN16]|uniref:GerAB/ArcD/ProY family transporter n=1 Tax=Bacillus sp. REN16 TaxID=2887296 RepID=UPI001E577A36|nr:GerAB/ArcD/ProY family transporter [Bacillus sp. REN16]MCC3357927.1 spore germination protein [Bacillus sp. REN16]
MNSKMSENKLVSPFFLFFLFHGSQTGITLLKYQRSIAQGAGYDAWLSVFVVGLSTHLIFFMMLYIIKQSTAGDILSLHKDIFGKFFGGALNILLACYFSVAGVSVLYSYIDALQVWVFDGIASWEYALVLCILIFYLVAGGFRCITGVAFWGVVIPSFLLLSLLYLIQYLEISYLLPPFKYGLKEHYISTKESVPLFLGFETALIYFPFLKNGKKASKWGHFALFLTTIMYTVITIVTFMFFTEGKLQHLTWPTLTMIKIIEFSFLERFEFIFIFTWLLVIMPVICIYLWSAVRSIKFTLPKIKPTYILLFLLALYLYTNSFLIDLYYTQLIRKIVKYSGTLFIYGYIPLIFLISVIRNLIKSQRKA